MGRLVDLLFTDITGHTQRRLKAQYEVQWEDRKHLRHMFFGIQWPLADGLDDWKVMALNVLKDDSRLQIGTRNCFDIRVVDAYIERAGITLNRATQHSYNSLKSVSGVDFDLIPEGIYQRMPCWFEHVISAGRFFPPMIYDRSLVDD